MSTLDRVLPAGRRTPVLVALALVLAFFGPAAMQEGGYLETVLIMIALFAVLALSTDLLLGRLGLPSMANGALFAVGAYTLSVLTVEREQGFWLSFVAAVVVAGLVGLVLGFVTMRSSGHYFAVSSLAFAGAIVVILPAWTDLTRGAAGIFNIGRPEDLELFGLSIELGSTRGQYYLAMILLVASITIVHRLDRSDFGRRSQLIMVDPVLAGSVGVNVFTSKLKSFTISAAMAGAAGALYASYISYIDPSLASHLTGFNALVYCIVGGSGRLFGPVIGTAIVVGLTESFRITEQLSQLLFGVALILILLFMRHGVMGGLDRLANLTFMRRDPLPQAPTAADRPDVDEALAPDEQPLVPTTRAPVSGPPLLTVTGMTKAYGGVKAVDGVDLQVSAGEVVGVMGPNGAGKSTLFGMVAGTIAASSGSVVLDGTDVSRQPAFRRSRRGIARTFQTNRVLLESTVLENVQAAALSSRHGGRDGEDLVEVLRRAHLADRADVPAGLLTVEEQRLLGVAMALATRPRVLLLDEPFAGLREVETPRLQSLLESLRAEGVAIVLVEHKLKVLMALSDRVYALDRGRIIAEGTPEQIMDDPAVIDAYLGSSSVGTH